MGIRVNKRRISLTTDQAKLCRETLCRELVRVLGLLKSKKDEKGKNLTASAERKLSGLGHRLQMTLFALGLTPEEVETITRDPGNDP